MKKLCICFGIILLIATQACHPISRKTKEVVVAECYGKYLYESDLKGIVPEHASIIDSIQLVNNYIDSWLRQELLLHQAENNLKKEDLDLDKKIKEYQNSLVVYAYETQLINQKLDTLVSDSEVEAYYEDNKANFQLRNNMVKAAYVILDLNNANKESFRKLLSDKDTLMLQNLDVMANYYAVSSYLNVDAWIRLDDLTHIIPIEILNAESFLKKNKFVALDDADYSYMVRFVDYLLEETVAPLELVKDDIKNVILTQRKKDLLDRMKASIYEKAKKEHAFEVYVGMPALDNAD